MAGTNRDHGGMSESTTTDVRRSVPPVVGILMGVMAVSLAVMSSLHLSGGLAGGSPPFRDDGAGIAEAVIAVVLAGGVVAVFRTPGAARVAALGTTGFAIVGFLVGLSFTLRGGSTVDVIYHAVGLAVLVFTMISSLRSSTHR